MNISNIDKLTIFIYKFVIKSYIFYINQTSLSIHLFSRS
nr:MAG TPA_asm: hypothetical protein [Bacteriophage sp.]